MVPGESFSYCWWQTLTLFPLKHHQQECKPLTVNQSKMLQEEFNSHCHLNVIKVWECQIKEEECSKTIPKCHTRNMRLNRNKTLSTLNQQNLLEISHERSWNCKQSVFRSDFAMSLFTTKQKKTGDLPDRDDLNSSVRSTELTKRWIGEI